MTSPFRQADRAHLEPLLQERERLLAALETRLGSRDRHALDELERMLRDAHRGPLDDFAALLAEMDAAIAAQRAAARQRTHRRRSGAMTLGLLVGALGLMAGPTASDALAAKRRAEERCVSPDGCFGTACALRSTYVGGFEWSHHCEAIACDPERCARFGECAVHEGVCRATRDEHCERSESCREDGRCGAVDGHCVAVRASDCARSDACRNHGACLLEEGRRWCHARPEPEDDPAPTRGDCVRASHCVASGFCRAGDVPTACADMDIDLRDRRLWRRPVTVVGLATP